MKKIKWANNIIGVGYHHSNSYGFSFTTEFAYCIVDGVLMRYEHEEDGGSYNYEWIEGLKDVIAEKCTYLNNPTLKEGWTLERMEKETGQKINVYETGYWQKLC